MWLILASRHSTFGSMHICLCTHGHTLGRLAKHFYTAMNEPKCGVTLSERVSDTEGEDEGDLLHVEGRCH